MNSFHFKLQTCFIIADCAADSEQKQEKRRNTRTLQDS
jgi:hypothetical protein